MTNSRTDHALFRTVHARNDDSIVIFNGTGRKKGPLRLSHFANEPSVLIIREYKNHYIIKFPSFRWYGLSKYANCRTSQRNRLFWKYSEHRSSTDYGNRFIVCFEYCKKIWFTTSAWSTLDVRKYESNIKDYFPFSLYKYLYISPY